MKFTSVMRLISWICPRDSETVPLYITYMFYPKICITYTVNPSSYKICTVNSWLYITYTVNREAFSSQHLMQIAVVINLLDCSGVSTI